MHAHVCIYLQQRPPQQPDGGLPLFPPSPVQEAVGVVQAEGAQARVVAERGEELFVWFFLKGKCYVDQDQYSVRVRFFVFFLRGAVMCVDQYSVRVWFFVFHPSIQSANSPGRRTHLRRVLYTQPRPPPRRRQVEAPQARG